MDARHIRIDTAGLRGLSDLLRGYVESGKLAGTAGLVWQGGREVFWEAYGMAEIESGRKMARDTVFRIYSMTKPITSLALMMLWEEGRFDLDDPVAKYLPEFGDMKVHVGGEGDDLQTVAADRPITIRHLLTHTAGLARSDQTAMGKVYTANGLTGSSSSAGTTEQIVAKIASLPLSFHPGDQWRYSMATDVCGWLVTVLSGQSLDVFFRERILGPLGMDETGFQLPDDQVSRFAANYGPDGKGGLACIDAPATSPFRKKPAHVSGGGGLLSTADDYLRFARMLLNGGELDGVRLVKRDTLELMRRNHLPRDIANMGAADFNKEKWDGIGFGLGFSVVLDPAKTGYGNAGLHGWTGAASTLFFVDPAADLIAMELAQFRPSFTYPLRREFRHAVYAAVR